MKLFIKRISYKILIISMITVVLSFFSVSSICEAKLKLEEGEFYYTGTQEAQAKFETGLFEKIIDSLAQIANYILGIMTLGIRGVVVGWIEIMEIILTAILGVETDIGQFFADALSGMDGYSQQVVNVEKIIFNKIPILNANIFSRDSEFNVGDEEGETTPVKKLTDSDHVVRIIKDSVAKWYYVMRLIAMAFMLIILIFIGIKMALSTISSEKAVYKQMLVDWVAGMILVFSIHYIMIFILNINDSIINALEPLSQEPSEIVQEYQYGDEQNVKTSGEIETTLYESVRTRAYSLKLTDGFTGMIIYGVLVYYAWRYALIYFRRMINIVLLTLAAPAVSASYALNKVLTGKSKIFSSWLSDFIMNVVIQIVHVVIYVSFVSVALVLSVASLSGIILAFVLLNFMAKADKLLRQIFKVSGGKGSLAGDMADHTSFEEMKSEMSGLKQAMTGGPLVKAGMKMTYGIVTKPIKEAGLYALAGTVAAVKNSEHHQNRMRKKEEDEKEAQEKAAEEYIKNNEEAAKTVKEIDELEANKQTMLNEKARLQRELKKCAQRKQADKKAGKRKQEKIEEAKYQKIKDQIEENDKQVKEIDQDITKKKEALEKAYLTEYINSADPSIFEVLKGNIGSALNGLVEERKIEKKNGQKVTKFKVRKVETRKEGGLKGGRKGAFWRKTEDSLGLRFKENMALNSLFGINSSEREILKSEMKFWQNRVKGLFLTVSGFPMLVISPLAGMALLTDGAVSHLDAKTRRRRYKNKISNIQRHSYTFSAFGPGTVKRLSRAQSYHILEMDQLQVLKHKRVKKEVKNLMQYSRYLDKKTEKIKQKTVNLKEQYTKSMYQYENKVKDEVSNKTKNELLFEEKARQKDIVNVGNGICMQLETNVAMNRFMDEIKEINARTDLSSSKKIRKIHEKMQQNKNMIITEGITTLCAQKGITDIKKVTLTDAEMFQINYNILDRIEKSGVVKKGEIDLEKVKINKESISDTYSEMMTESEETNKTLQDNMVASTILEYMQENAIKDRTQLRTEEAQLEIYGMIKEKMMPESSKKSASVIEKLTGKNTVKEEFEVPDSIIESVRENTKKVKKINSNDIIKEAEKMNKDDLVQREVNRKVNETKERLGKVVYLETMMELNGYYKPNNAETQNEAQAQIQAEYAQIEENIDEDQLQMLFVLSELKKQNNLADEFGIRIRENEEENHNTKARAMQYEQINKNEQQDDFQNGGWHGDIWQSDDEVEATWQNSDTSEDENLGFDQSVNGNWRLDESGDGSWIFEELGDRNWQIDELRDGSLTFDESKNGSRRFDVTKDGSRRFDVTKDGSLKVQRQLEELETQLHGPAVDIIDLINNVGKNNTKR